MLHRRWIARMFAVALLMPFGLCADERTTPSPAAAEQGDVAAAEDAAPQADAPADLRNSLRQKEAALRRALGTRVTASFDERPLEEAVRELAKSARVLVWFDLAALPEEGIAADKPVTAAFRDVSLRRAFKRMLDPLGLTFVPQGDVLRITTQLAAEEVLVPRVYDVATLLPLGDEPTAAQGAPSANGDWLVDLVQNLTEGPWDDIDGTGGQTRLAGGFLLVRQTDANHHEIGGILAGLQTLAGGNGESKVIDLRPDSAADENAALQRKLAQPVTVAFKDKPLREVMADLASRADVPIRLDEQELTKEGIATDEPITIELQEVALATALRLMTEEKGLEVVVDGRTLVITSMPAAAELLYPVLYYVRDLVASGITLPELETAAIALTGGPWQTVDGTGGVVTTVPAGALAILQTPRNHAAIVRLFDDLRRKQQKRSPAETALVRQQSRGPDAVVLRFYPQPKERAEDVLDAIRIFVLPETWTGDRPVATAQIIDGTIAIRHTTAAHQKIQQFIVDLTKAEASRPPPQQGFGGIGSGGSFFRLPDDLRTQKIR